MTEIVNMKIDGRTIKVTFADNSKGTLPFLWLKDNCQCPACFDKVALGRNFLMQNLDIDIHPKKVHMNGNNVEITWSDDHESTFDSKWFYARAFNAEARNKYKNLYRLQRVSNKINKPKH